MGNVVLTRKQERELKTTGTTNSFFDTSRNKRYYRKADGMLHPVPLPVDDDMLMIYQGKGWHPVSDSIALPEVEAMVEAKIQAKMEMQASSDGHQHRFGKRLGSTCTQEDCPEVRTKPYMKRSKNE